MKRSEMVNKLRQIVLYHMNCLCCTTDEEMYSKMLAELEAAGMQPPNTSLDSLFPDSGLSTAVGAKIHYYSLWEPEPKPGE